MIYITGWLMEKKKTERNFIFPDKILSEGPSFKTILYNDPYFL